MNLFKVFYLNYWYNIVNQKSEYLFYTHPCTPLRRGMWNSFSDLQYFILIIIIIIRLTLNKLCLIMDTKPCY